MVNEYKAEMIDGQLVVKPKVTKKPNGDVLVELPSLPVIAAAKKQYEEEHGKRSL